MMRGPFDLSVKDAAAYLGLSLDTVYALVQRGQIECVRTSSSRFTRRLKDGRLKTCTRNSGLRFSRAGLDDYLARTRVVTPTRPALRPQPVSAPDGDDLPIKRRRFA